MPFDDGLNQVAGFSLHAYVVAKDHQRKKLERLCRYIGRPAIAEKRLSLTPMATSATNSKHRIVMAQPGRVRTCHF